MHLHYRGITDVRTPMQLSKLYVNSNCQIGVHAQAPGWHVPLCFTAGDANIVVGIVTTSFGFFDVDTSSSRPRQPDQLQPSRRRTRSSHSSDAFESLHLRRGTAAYIPL